MANNSSLLLRSNANYRSSALTATLVIDKDKTSYEALSALAVMLLLASKAYRDERGLVLRMMNLYSSSLSLSTKRYKDKYLFDISLSCPIDKYVGVNSLLSLEGKILKTCQKILADGFNHDEVALMLTKGKLVRDNNDATGNPMFLAYEGLKNNFFPNANFASYPNGDNSRILALTFEDLEKALEVVRSSKAYVGCVGFQRKAKSLSSIFNLADGMPVYDYDVDQSKKCADLSMTKDVITSSYLVIGYSLSLDEGYKGDIEAMLLERLLCDDSSPLFLGLREERGLTYGVDVTFPSEHKSMIVSMVLDRQNVAPAIKATEEILKSSDDKFTQERLDQVKKTMKSGVDAMFDSPMSYSHFLKGSLMNGYPSTKDEYVASIDAITLDEIKEKVKGMRKVGSFSVDPSEA